MLPFALLGLLGFALLVLVPERGGGSRAGSKAPPLEAEQPAPARRRAIPRPA